ncbi:COX aromatic rich motif-containing protein [Paenibacillus pasadenensis]|uniref:ubiquinol oxidase subunit II n=1 Tax=Paenibacillus pasadenensis TaxID=217090 RepID=UPI00203EEB06|nr:ubiquinol oxidase subunit II [Paenibacillus pasadenensis]MCM3748972.1 COX aromatic rich motif-containing protein [Paenibacillus pasadenensis]
MKSAHNRLRRLGILLAGAGMAILLAGCGNPMVLDPKGSVAEIQKEMIWISIILCAIIIIPVLGIWIYISWRYRDKPDNKAPYEPNWSHSTKLEAIWWGIPIVVVGVLGYFTIVATYDLIKPPKQAADVKPITVQVTSMDWKWLFQYPDQDIATVNYLNIPDNTPVQFVLTSNTAMNSFWVPQLGGMMYTMPGMAMRLWLDSNESGEYLGMGANFSGSEFAKMNFKVTSMPQEEFDAWVKKSQAEPAKLDHDAYKKLAVKGTAPIQTFGEMDHTLFQSIIVQNGGHHGLKIRGSYPVKQDEIKDMSGDTAAGSNETTGAGQPEQNQ